ncbi:MAG: lysoplasmalogenase [Acidimicrobiales bacterium]
MTTTAWFLAGAAALFAATDWIGVATSRRGLRRLAKPATLTLLVGVAVTLDPVDPSIRAWMVVGLCFSLVGDVALMLPERWFVVGLGAFLLGHVAYVVAMVLAPTSAPGLAIGALLVAVAGAVVGRRIVAAVRTGQHPELGPPVIAYILVISAMVIAALGTTATAAILGALLFYASDATLAWNRFVEPLRHGPLAVMITYHLGQAGLVAWLVTG